MCGPTAAHSYFSKQFLERFAVNTESEPGQDVHHRPLYSSQLAGPRNRLSQIPSQGLATPPPPAPGRGDNIFAQFPFYYCT